MRARLEGAPDFSERLLRKWQAAIRRRHGARWRSWVEGQRAKGGGAIYKWMQRLGPDEGLAGLGGAGSNAERVEAGWAAWSALWVGGSALRGPVLEAAPLPVITAEALRAALRRMSPRKSRGADGWGPRELGSLPTSYLQGLCRLIAGWEAQGAWPDALSQVFVTLILKPGAQSEGQLRPIGIPPYVYGAWMVVRKAEFSGWSRALHGGRHVWAADLAAQVRREEEYAAWRGCHSFTTYLDCSKC